MLKVRMKAVVRETMQWPGMPADMEHLKEWLPKIEAFQDWFDAKAHKSLRRTWRGEMLVIEEHLVVRPGQWVVLCPSGTVSVVDDLTAQYEILDDDGSPL